ncbi:fumarate reductase [Nocardioides sp. Root151]|nr:fumarate reductase [Nocardioides sp. Root140]KQZ67681.1 fumarate reductase [Nocardioides sp. Root151]KRF13212.1 fumarate reductase [Nocardioides sp. Soil796]
MPRESARPTDRLDFDTVTDVVVVGGGGAGLPTALFTRWGGAEVIVLEKAEQVGGTALKAAYWYWVPDNEPMRAAGLHDDETDYLRFVARLSYPARYDAGSPTFGLTDLELRGLRAIHESASPAAELLNERGALPYRHVPDVPDYHSELPEDVANRGRVLIHRDAAETMHDGGRVTTRSLAEAAERDGVDIRLRHRVQRAVVHEGRVVGVEATTADGTPVRIGARKAVVFTSGGFTHDDELRRNHLAHPVFPGCAAPTNEGDFLRIAMPLGAQPRNMNAAWMCPLPLEKTVARRPDLSGTFTMVGDSMVIVNKEGRRFVNEKLQYHEIAQSFFRWDGEAAEYPNLVSVCVWDQRTAETAGNDRFGSVIPAPGSEDTAHVIVGETLADLAEQIRLRFEKYAAHTGGARVADDFLPTLRNTLETFNAAAHAGEDAEFHRGERPIQHVFNGAVPDDDHGANPTMFPISDTGPYYATLLTGGTLDTKGGPQVDEDARVLDDSGEPIPGLYGVGNCVASFSGGSYWAGGATLGPIIAFSYRAAASITGSVADSVTGEAAASR